MEPVHDDHNFGTPRRSGRALRADAQPVPLGEDGQRSARGACFLEVDSVAAQAQDASMNVRRLAAVDMHGAAGRAVRRRIILAEFVLGFVGMVAIGIWMVVFTRSVGWWIFGAWLIGVGLNYLPVAVYAISLSRAGRLEAELAGADLTAEGRHYTRVQWWIFVPLAIVVFALRHRP
jgi:hypothetical protein